MYMIRMERGKIDLISLTRVLPEPAGGVKLNATGTLESTDLSYLESNQNMGKEARKRPDPLVGSTFPESTRPKDQRLALIKRNSFLRFTLSLNEMIKPATDVNRQEMSMKQCHPSPKKNDNFVDMGSLNVVINRARPVATSATTQISPGNESTIHSTEKMTSSQGRQSDCTHNIVCISPESTGKSLKCQLMSFHVHLIVNPPK
jgi:hypothetical protein